MATNSTADPMLFPENQWIPQTMPPIAGASIVIQGSAITSFGGSSFVNPGRLSNFTFILNFSTDVQAGPTALPTLIGPPLPIRIFDLVVSSLPESSILRVLGGAWINTAGIMEVNPNIVESTTDALGWKVVNSNFVNSNIFAQPCMSTTASTDGVQWLFGGRRGISNSPYTDVLAKVSLKDPVTVETFQKQMYGPWPSTRGTGLLLKLNNTHLFLGGGFTDAQEPLSDWWVYDIIAKNWTQGPTPMLVARAGHRGVTVGAGGRYVIYSGGWATAAPKPFLEVVDTHARTVTGIDSSSHQAPVPTDLAQHNMALIQNQLVLFNGYTAHDHLASDLRHNRQMFIATMDKASGPLPFTFTWKSKFATGHSFDTNLLGETRGGLPHSSVIAISVCAAILILLIALYLSRVRAKKIFQNGFLKGVNNTDTHHQHNVYPPPPASSSERPMCASSSERAPDPHQDHTCGTRTPSLPPYQYDPRLSDPRNRRSEPIEMPRPDTQYSAHSVPYDLIHQSPRPQFPPRPPNTRNSMPSSRFDNDIYLPSVTENRFVLPPAESGPRYVLPSETVQRPESNWKSVLDKADDDEELILPEGPDPDLSKK